MPSLHCHGFYIEFKVPGNFLTTKQSEFAMRMTNAGYLCHVYTDAMLAYEAVKAYSKNQELDVWQWKKYSKEYPDERLV